MLQSLSYSMCLVLGQKVMGVSHLLEVGVSKGQWCGAATSDRPQRMFLEWGCVYLSFIKFEVPLMELTLEQAADN